MHVERAESWSHLQELLFADVWNPQLGRWRADAVYPRRGARDERSHDEPAAARRPVRRPRAPSPAQLPQVRAPRRRVARVDLALARARQAPRPAHAPARLVALALRRAALRDREPRAARRRRRASWRSTTCEPRSTCRPPCATSSPRRAPTPSPRTCSTAQSRPLDGARRARRRRPVRRLLRAALARRADHEPVRRVLVHVGSRRRASTTGWPAHPELVRRIDVPAGAQARGPRQARPGERHRARPLPGPRRNRALADAALRARALRPEDERDPRPVAPTRRRVS